MMDMYAKDIVGYDVKDDLTAEGPLAAPKHPKMPTLAKMANSKTYTF